MKNKKLFAIGIMFPLFILGACETIDKAETKVEKAVADAHNSKSSLDWAGAYQGILPCADCEGIKSVLKITKDGNYSFDSKYLGKSDEVSTETGKFSWSADGNKIAAGSMKFKVAENRVIWLDGDGKVIEGPLANKFILEKLPMANLTETYWKLVELNGQKVVTTHSEAHFILKNDGKINGSGGCNRFFGSYETKDNAQGIGKISFSQMGMTKMACLGEGNTENLFMDALSKADSYTLNGETLQLNRGRMAPLAKFEAVYLR